ncbi:hypothetical protein C8R30_101145 [Nitrosomonas nitrosa]|uniref:hypothetical protein n=1 Tax=Nitrosomonas nitrosa TaxID=52442 RepID=UPI000D3138F1|nr:hypothetical protein [Nitrosomonas nitrosa]PTR04948.1 hypothetical protein C8R30_101145 [Nitrosomonas nitrosa]
MEELSLDYLLTESTLTGKPIMQIILEKRNQEIILKNEQEEMNHNLTIEDRRAMRLAGACATKTIGYSKSSLCHRAKIKN